MRKGSIFSVVLYLFLLVPASITWAQNITQEKGLTTATFNVSQGTIRVYLPDDIRQGDVITGTVTAVPEGRNEKQSQRNLSELLQHAVVFNGQKFTFEQASRSFRFITQPVSNNQQGLGLLQGNSVNPVQQLNIPAKLLSEKKPTPVQCVIPGHVLTGSPMNIPGPFDGNATNTQCTIGNQPATILAESPRNCVVSFPANVNGIQSTVVQENGEQPCTKEVSAVQMEVSAGKLDLRKGQQTFIDVRITGLQGLEQTAFLKLVNLTTATVNLQPGNLISIPLEPEAVSSGLFTQRFDVQSIQGGTFTISCNLDFGGPMLSPMPDEKSEEEDKDVKVPNNEKKPPNPKLPIVPDEPRMPVDSIPDKNIRSCSRSTGEDILPIMNGGLKLDKDGIHKDAFVVPRKRTIKRDDFVLLVAEGADFDMFIIQCTKAGNCPEGNTVKIVPLSGRVRFEWEIIGGPGLGQFVKLGCLYTKKEDGQKTKGEQVIFMPPVLPLPVLSKDTAVTTKIKLSIIDDKESLKDPQVDREFEIITRRNTDRPDEYKVDINYKDKDNYTLPRSVSRDAKGKCEAFAGLWEKKNDLVQPKIILPDVDDNKKMVLGQWIILEADDQRESDILPGIDCITACSEIEPFAKTSEDNVQWTWSASGGNFIAGKKGRYVIYQAPTSFPDGQTEMKIVLKVTVSNEGGAQAEDESKDSDEVEIMVYQPGITMQFPKADWVPSYNNSATVKSELRYFENEKWQPALAHMSRILFFELIDVSNEKGICLNDPPWGKGDDCFDLQFKQTKNGDRHESFSPVNFTMADYTKCSLKNQYMMARTVKPEKEFEVEVLSLDYGSYGYVRSFANVVRGIERIEKQVKEREKQQEEGNPDFQFKYKSVDRADNSIPPVYQSVPWSKSEITHPFSRQSSNVYTDNRVTIPRDIDENHIADNGWETINQKTATTDSRDNNSDTDDLPVGNKTKGDGLTAYEEYRGFKVISGEKTIHVRTSPEKKDIFIYNRNNLDISLYRKLTGLEVHEVRLENIVPEAGGEDARVINFNIRNYSPTHIVNQKGLRLIDAGSISGLLGVACPTPECPVTGPVGPPNWTYEIRIYTKTISKVCSLKKLNEKEKLAQVIAHELCHGNNVCHHGEGNPEIDGDYNKPNGLRSGDLNCIMRYDNSGTPILGKFKTGVNKGKNIPEIIGNHLCISGEGTGYNRSGIKPGFESSAPGRGNCLHQLQITGLGNKPETCKH